MAAMSFKRNDLVKIDFLSARPDLNDRVAELVEFLPQRGRWHAHVLETGEHVCIKPENCLSDDWTLFSATKTCLHLLIPTTV